jgi:hypothetical protein
MVQYNGREIYSDVNLAHFSDTGRIPQSPQKGECFQEERMDQWGKV